MRDGAFTETRLEYITLLFTFKRCQKWIAPDVCGDKRSKMLGTRDCYNTFVQACCVSQCDCRTTTRPSIKLDIGCTRMPAKQESRQALEVVHVADPRHSHMLLPGLPEHGPPS